MHALLYRSSARAGLLANDLNAIIEKAKVRNATLDITGLLLHGHLESVAIAPGEFVQWLEGPREAVEALYAEIANDSRHSRQEVLGRGPVSALASRTDLEGDRLFPSWSMGLLSMAELPATLNGFLRFATEWTSLEDAAAYLPAG